MIASASAVKTSTETKIKELEALIRDVEEKSTLGQALANLLATLKSLLSSMTTVVTLTSGKKRRETGNFYLIPFTMSSLFQPMPAPK